MKPILYLLSLLTLFILPTSASQTTWNGEPSGFTSLLRKLYNKSAMTLTGQHPLLSIDSVRKPENTVIVRKAMDEANMTLIKLCTTLSNNIILPQHLKLVKDCYMEHRVASNASDRFDDFDVRFYDRLYRVQVLNRNSDWDRLKDISSKEEVICEAMYFYDLIDFERAITCVDAVSPVVSLTPKIFSKFVADMYFGETSRPDFSYEGDVETRKWLDDMVKKYTRIHHPQTTSVMRRFTRNIRGKMDKGLWDNYMRAMMTVHLSAALLLMSENGSKELYDYLADNHISSEFMFASRKLGSPEPGETALSGHAFLRTFKLDPNSLTATMGIVNSGDGLQFHDSKSFKLGELPDTISEDPRAKSVTRYIPFIVYDAVPKSEWEPAYTVVDSMDKAYFNHKLKKHKFSDYKKWQYIDDQRAGTCTAMSLWSALYWFEQESQQNLESFRLALHLEMLKMAANILAVLRKDIEALDRRIFEMDDNDPKQDGLQLTIKEWSEIEDDYLRLFSVGFNSAIRSIRYLHTDPFGQKLDMTSIMQDYADFYESQGGEKYWTLVKPNIDDLFHSTYLEVVKPMIWVIPFNTPKISTKERDCVDGVNQAIEANVPFNFVRAVVGGTDLKCQSKAFLESIQSGIGVLDLQTHHQDLILRALAKEVRLLRGGRLPILRLIQRLINDYHFKFTPIYDIPPKESIDFTKNIHQVFELEDDTEMRQFAVNCFEYILFVNILAAANDLVKSAKKSIPDLETRVNIKDTEEYKLHKGLIERYFVELQSVDPHTYARYLASLILNAERTGIAEYIDLFRPSKEWTRIDYDFLERAAKKSGSHRGDLIREQLDHFYDFIIGRELTSKYSFILSNNLPINERTHTRNVVRAIDANSSLDLVRAVISGVDRECESELFLSSITFGMDTLNLQSYHQYLILQTLLRHKNVPQMLKFINKLVVRHSVKLFSRDNTLSSVDGDTYDVPDFFLRAIYIENEDEVRQFVADLNKNESTASLILKKCTEHNDLIELRSHFVNHIFEELQGMSPRLYAYHLSRLINQKALYLDDFASTSFKLSEKWDDYDYVLIKNAIKSDPRREEYSKVFNFPRKYRINTKNVRKETEFELMSANPSDETLMEYARMLFKTTKKEPLKKILKKKKKKARVESGHKG